MNITLTIAFLISLSGVAALLYIGKKRLTLADLEESSNLSIPGFRDVFEKTMSVTKKSSHKAILLAIKNVAYLSHKAEKFAEKKFPNISAKLKQENEERVLSFFLKTIGEYKSAFKNIKNKIGLEETKKDFAKYIVRKVEALQTHKK